MAVKISLSTLLELLGLLCIVVGAFGIDWTAGVITSGLLAIGAGWQLGDDEVDE